MMRVWPSICAEKGNEFREKKISEIHDDTEATQALRGLTPLVLSHLIRADLRVRHQNKYRSSLPTDSPTDQKKARTTNALVKGHLVVLIQGLASSGANSTLCLSMISWIGRKLNGNMTTGRLLRERMPG